MTFIIHTKYTEHGEFEMEVEAKDIEELAEKVDLNYYSYAEVKE